MKKRLIGNEENNSLRGQFPVLFLKQLLPCFDACEAACSVINIIHKPLDYCLRSSLISLSDAASAPGTGVSSGNIFHNCHIDTVLHPLIYGHQVTANS